MVYRRSIHLASGLVVLILLTAGCDDLLVVNPTEEVTSEVATGSLSSVESLLAGIYNRMQFGNNYGSHMLLVPDILADVARPSDPPQQFDGEYLNEHEEHLDGYEHRYRAINEANFTIAAADALEDASPADRNRIKGEALFLRALNYFDLARIYAYEPNRSVDGWDHGVVIRTEPTRTAGDADLRPRSSVLETYQQIEADLLESIQLLSSDGTTDVFFANQAAAEALLARVYLYWQRWDDAVTYATRALTSTDAQLASPDEVEAMFDQVPNPESIWELNYDPSTESLWVNVCMGCYTQPTGTWFSIWPTAELLALFEPGDARLALYPVTTGDDGQPPGIPYNNKWTESEGDNTDNKPIIRVSEVLLIRAEAYAELDDEPMALADLNALRAQRGVAPSTASGPGLIQAILDERRRELAFEGHRWFDLKRRGMDIPKTAHSGLSPLPYTDYRMLAPLPSTQVDNNPELAQNPGY